MEYSGSYVFRLTDLASYRSIELAPNIFAYVVSERVSLCHTKKSTKRVCFWEGDCEVTLDINGQKVTVNDHDEKKGTRSYFVCDGISYYVVGHLFHLDDDEVTRLRYTVYKPL